MKQKSNWQSWLSALVVTWFLGFGTGFSLYYALDDRGSDRPSGDLAAAPRPADPISQPEPDRPSVESVTEPTGEPVETAAEKPLVVAKVEDAPEPADTGSEPSPSQESEELDDGIWAARHLFITVSGHWINQRSRDYLSELKPGGIVLHETNLNTLSQTTALVRDIKDAVGLGGRFGDLPLIAFDHEGDRYSLRGMAQVPTAAELGLAEDPAEARRVGREFAMACVDRGINVIFGPLLDVYESGSAFPQFRSASFGSEQDVVTNVGLALAAGIMDGGALPVVKHFPGYGASRWARNGRSAVLNKDYRGLAQAMYPFNEAVSHDVPGVLVGHVAIPALDKDFPDRPAALSPVLMGTLLRKRWGFEGVIIAGDPAIGTRRTTADPTVWVVEALEAGCDAVVLLETPHAEVMAVCRAIEEAVRSGRIARENLDDSKERLSAWQAWLHHPQPMKGADALAPPALLAKQTEEIPVHLPSSPPMPPSFMVRAKRPMLQATPRLPEDVQRSVIEFLPPSHETTQPQAPPEIDGVSVQDAEADQPVEVAAVEVAQPRPVFVDEVIADESLAEGQSIPTAGEVAAEEGGSPDVAEGEGSAPQDEAMVVAELVEADTEGDEVANNSSLTDEEIDEVSAQAEVGTESEGATEEPTGDAPPMDEDEAPALAEDRLEPMVVAQAGETSQAESETIAAEEEVPSEPPAPGLSGEEPKAEENPVPVELPGDDGPEAVQFEDIDLSEDAPEAGEESVDTKLEDLEKNDEADEDVAGAPEAQEVAEELAEPLVLAKQLDDPLDIGEALADMAEEEELVELVHEVRPGDTLGRIASRLDVKAADIQKWNDLDDSYVNFGSELTVYVSAEKAETMLADLEANPPPELQRVVHRIRSGESLTSISQKYGINMRDLVIWNRLSDSRLLIGKTLVVFVGENSVEEDDSGEPAIMNYRVRRGDTLSKIARRFGTTGRTLLTMNRLSNANHIVVGQRLKVPLHP